MTVGGSAFFEYHCLESPESADAELWYRSHTRVDILEELPADETRVYSVRFPDGYIGSAFTDELLASEADYYRPDPPTRTGTGADRQAV